MNRRSFLALPAVLAAASSKIRIGVTDWNLELAGNPEALDLASSIGFAGVEISLGRKPVNGKLPMDNPSLHALYKERAKQLNIELVSTCLDILHINGLKNDKLGEKWVADAIEINRKMGLRVILLPFFGSRQMETNAELDYVADVLKNLAASALMAGVVLGLENTNSAQDNLRILNRTKSEAVKVFYDTGNSFYRGHDIYREIPLLGRERICQFHLKDNPSYMGQGGIDFRRVVDLIQGIGYEGFVDLETSSPTRKIADDMSRNLKFLTSLIGG